MSVSFNPANTQQAKPVVKTPIRFSGWSDWRDELRGHLEKNNGDSYSARTDRTGSAGAGQSRIATLADKLQAHLEDKLDVQFMVADPAILNDTAKRVLLFNEFNGHPDLRDAFNKLVNDWSQDQGGLSKKDTAMVLKHIFTARPVNDAPDAVLKCVMEGMNTSEDFARQTIEECRSFGLNEIVKLGKPELKVDKPYAVERFEDLRDSYDASYHLNSFIQDYNDERGQYTLDVLVEPEMFKRGGIFNSNGKSKDHDPVSSFEYPIDKGVMTAFAPKDSDASIRWIQYEKDGRDHEVTFARAEGDSVRYYRFKHTSPRMGEDKDYTANRLLIDLNRYFAQAYLDKTQA